MKKFSSLIIALAACIAGFAQNARTVSGIVTESDGTPVVAAMVIEKGTMNGASTDIDGKYSIRVSDKDIVLEISCIGFETLEVPVSGTQAIANATLKQDNMLIDDAIVIGYGVQNRRDVTTSIVSMKAEDMTNKTNADFREMMAAKMPGVQVLQLGGRPAGNVSVRIRGIQSATSGNDPLYVIDGIPTESSVFSQLDASDIESIEVLKDASAAAIYGSRGSCGVILITTKRGNSEQPRITYDGYYGIAQVSKKIDLLDAWEFATMFKEARNGSYLYSVPTGSIGDPNSVRPEVYNRIPGVVETYLKDTGHTLTNTDWQDAIFRNAQTTRHAVSVSGKAGSANYYIGANYLYREGTIICSDYQRYSIRANIDGKKGRLKYGISVNPSYSAENYVDSDSQYGSDGVIASALMAPPIFPVKNADGSYNWDMNGYLRKNLGDGVGDTQTNEVLNPVALANEVKDFREKMNILGNAYASFEIIDGLEYRITAGGDYYGYARDYYRPSTIPLKGNKYIELDSDPTMPAIPRTSPSLMLKLIFGPSLVTCRSLTSRTTSSVNSSSVLLTFISMNGKYVYVLPNETMYKRVHKSQSAREMLANPGSISLEFTGNIGVLKTRPGYASLLAYNIDNSDLHDILGTIAGDDTIFIAIKEGIDRKSVAERLSEIIPELNIK